MKRLKISSVPEAAFFWRRNDPRRWERLGDYGATDDAPARPVPLPPLDEVVLLDPMICESCSSEQLWPPVGACPHCGHVDPEKTDRDTIKATIRSWSGQESPHI